MGFFDKIFKTKKDYFRLGISGEDRLYVQQKWNEVQKLVNLGNPSRFKTAIIEADKLLYFVLGKMGYSGSLGEKLSIARDRFVDNRDYRAYNDLWQAHKCRNRIVHESNYEVLSHEAHDVISKFESGFKELGVL